MSDAEAQKALSPEAQEEVKAVVAEMMPEAVKEAVQDAVETEVKPAVKEAVQEVAEEVVAPVVVQQVAEAMPEVVTEDMTIGDDGEVKVGDKVVVEALPSMIAARPLKRLDELVARREAIQQEKVALMDEISEINARAASEVNAVKNKIAELDREDAEIPAKAQALNNQIDRKQDEVNARLGIGAE